MSVSGTSPRKMAAVTDLSESYIIRLLSGKQNKTFNRLRDEYKRKNLKNAVGPFELGSPLRVWTYRTTLRIQRS